MSGLEIAKEDPYRVAVIYGSGIGSLGIIEEQHKILLEKGPTRISPFLVSGMIVNEVAGCIAIEIGAKGVNYAPVTACATGGHAIGEAFRAIKHGYADIAIGGGSESAITPLAVAGFAALRALSTRNDDPATASRPFTKTRDGFVIAEGAGAVILEEYEHAKARGANIIAEIVGYGATGDAYHLTAPDESGEAGARAVQLCLEEGKINPEDVTYVNAHGTSTPLNDKIETHVIKRAFGESAARKTMMSSTKSMTGHLLGGAGAIEAAIIALTVKNDAIPPTINYQDPDPECDLDYVPNAARKVPVKYAISNSLGFGGHNVCLALKKFS
jgi:3-oxoacyl-[acyl-carrier-protein] synthase II